MLCTTIISLLSELNIIKVSKLLKTCKCVRRRCITVDYERISRVSMSRGLQKLVNYFEKVIIPLVYFIIQLPFYFTVFTCIEWHKIVCLLYKIFTLLIVLNWKAWLFKLSLQGGMYEYIHDEFLSDLHILKNWKKF